jgi:hypothetical protein
MGVPNATGLWQVANIRNNGIPQDQVGGGLALAPPLEAQGLMKPKEQRRVPEGGHKSWCALTW